MVFVWKNTLNQLFKGGTKTYKKIEPVSPPTVLPIVPIKPHTKTRKRGKRENSLRRRAILQSYAKKINVIPISKDV